MSFETNQNEVDFLLNSSSRKASKLDSIVNNTVKTRKVEEIKGDLRQALLLISKMESQASRMGGAVGTRLASQCAQNRRDIGDIERDVKVSSRMRSGDTWGSDRSSIPYDADPELVGQNQQRHAYDTTATFHAGKERMKETIRIAEESESYGIDTLGALGQQRGQLESAQQNLDVIGSNMDKSKGILTSMARRAATNKIILMLVIFLLAAGIGIIIWLRWFPPN